MRKVDYMGSEPVASKLLFAPQATGSEADADQGAEYLDMSARLSGGVAQGGMGVKSFRCGKGERTNDT